MIRNAIQLPAMVVIVRIHLINRTQTSLTPVDIFQKLIFNIGPILLKRTTQGTAWDYLGRVLILKISNFFVS
jgi:hypothetical protein